MIINFNVQSKNLTSQKGQALTEYILLLVVVLALLGGVIYQFNTAFKVFADGWFVGENSYLACAIQNGILLDGETESSPCSVPRFDLRAGRTKDGSQVVDENGKPLRNNQSGKNNSAASGGGKNSSGSGGNAGRAEGNPVGVIPFNRADAKNYGLKNNEAGGDKSKANTGNSGFSSKTTTYIPAEEFSKSKSSADATKRNRFAPAGDEAVKEQTQNVPLNNRDLKSAREIAIEKAKKKAKGSDDSAIDLSFGNIFKYLMIFALFFSIIFFIGSQFLAVARSKKRK